LSTVKAYKVRPFASVRILPSLVSATPTCVPAAGGVPPADGSGVVWSLEQADTTRTSASGISIREATGFLIRLPSAPWLPSMLWEPPKAGPASRHTVSDDPAARAGCWLKANVPVGPG
jgi:hypothetical protein